MFLLDYHRRRPGRGIDSFGPDNLHPGMFWRGSRLQKNILYASESSFYYVYSLSHVCKRVQVKVSIVRM